MASSNSPDLDQLDALNGEHDALVRQLTALREEEKKLLCEHSRAKAEYFAEKNSGRDVLVRAEKMNSVAEREKILLESGSRVQYMIDSNMPPSYTVGADGIVVGGNQVCANFLGYERERFYDGSLSEDMLVPKKFRQLEAATRADFATAITSRPIVSERIDIRGKHIPMAVAFRSMKADGSQWSTFLMDLTETKNLEEKLWERQSLFATLVAEMPNQVFLIDSLGHTWHFNRRFYELTGLDPHEDDGYLSASSAHPDDVEENADGWRASIEKHQPFHGEARVRARNGQYIWHDFRTVPLCAPMRGQIDGLLGIAAQISPQLNDIKYNPESQFWIGTATDVDERKQAIDDVLESACNFQSLADQIPQILWTAGPDGRIDFFNNRWYEFSGLSRGIGLGLDFALFIHKDDRKNYVNLWRNCIKTGDALDIQFRLKKQGAGTTDFEDQDYETFLARAVAVRGAGGAIEQWVGTWTSI